MNGCLRLALCLGLLGISGCQSPSRNSGPKFDPRAKEPAVVTLTNLTAVASTNQLQPEWLKPSGKTFTLGPGDKIEIEVLGEAGTRSTVSVGPDGKIYYYLLPGINVWGLTLPQVKQRLESDLTKFLSAPKVAISLRGIESKRVWLMGRLQNAGVYPMGAPMTLLESISAAGGTLASSASGTTEDLADLKHSFVVRNGQMLPVDFEKLLKAGDVSQNIYLEPDDFVYLPSSLAREIYVLGAIRTPRVVSLSKQATLVGAIASTGGPMKDAYLSEVAIVRGTLSNPKIAVVNYTDIVKGRAPDVLLEAGDIVYVPLSPYRYLSKYADLILTTFVRAVAINEGARAGSRNAPTAGVAIGIGTTTIGR